MLEIEKHIERLSNYKRVLQNVLSEEDTYALKKRAEVERELIVTISLITMLIRMRCIEYYMIDNIRTRRLYNIIEKATRVTNVELREIMLFNTNYNNEKIIKALGRE